MGRPSCGHCGPTRSVPTHQRLWSGSSVGLTDGRYVEMMGPKKIRPFRDRFSCSRSFLCSALATGLSSRDAGQSQQVLSPAAALDGKGRAVAVEVGGFGLQTLRGRGLHASAPRTSDQLLERLQEAVREGVHEWEVGRIPKDAAVGGIMVQKRKERRTGRRSKTDNLRRQDRRDQ